MTIREDRVGLEDEIHTALQLNPYLTRNGVRCETKQGCVTLRKLRGIEEIDNQLTVNWE